MKTLTKTLALSMIFSATMLLSNLPDAQAKSFSLNSADSIKSDSLESIHEPDALEEFDFNFDDPFFFNDRIVVNIYNQDDELVYTKSFTKEESQQDNELKAILKKSEFLLSIGNQYYYSSNN